MISFTTTANVLRVLHHAHHIEMCAYVLRSKEVLDALEFAAQHQAHVSVRLEAHPYADPDGKLAKLNRDVVEKLQTAGVHASLADVANRRANHMKAAIVDGVAFLDDRNWPLDRRNVVVKDDAPRDVRTIHNALHGKPISTTALAVTKGSALAQEVAMLHGRATHSAVSIETESFTAGSAPYGAIKALARAGVDVRLLLCKEDAKPAMLSAARALARDGVTVRFTQAAEKFAVARDRGWIGSANATFGRAGQIDWGLRLSNPALCKTLQKRFDRTWRCAKPLDA
ncbi:MAG: hypothetical protein JO193_03535 [Candidatus Eremiobacteraeota bacterium]|nr:hypothetical protein [Candidatus Eremiobacteraeota bacterium]